MKLELVSDIACPWCAVGVHALDRAVQAIGDAIPISVVYQPFELNPDMPPEGADTIDYLRTKYGIDAAQIRGNQQAIRERGAAVGFAFGDRSRVWNTFDAHRLLHWAAIEGRQSELKHALLRAYHGQGRNPGAHDVLLELARAVGLDGARAAQVLAGDDFAAAVRQAEAAWQRAGIRAVPAAVVDGRHLISGGQPPEVYERALREIARGDPG